MQSQQDCSKIGFGKLSKKVVKDDPKNFALRKWKDAVAINSIEKLTEGDCEEGRIFFFKYF